MSTKQMFKEQTELSKTLVRRTTILTWVVTAVVVTLAGFGLWPWAWLVLAIFAVRQLSDMAAGLVISLSGLIMTTALSNRREP